MVTNPKAEWIGSGRFLDALQLKYYGPSDVNEYNAYVSAEAERLSTIANPLRTTIPKIPLLVIGLTRINR
jgi:hypothetical protein